MIGNGSVSFRLGWQVVLCATLLGCPMARAAGADCPGHPDALGTSRTLVVDPRQHPRIGTMQYPETLPLRDHEVVLTFDDGPLARNSNQVLQTLAEQCVKATFFIIGQQARADPEGVRKLVAAGHTIGTHSQTHPLTFAKLRLEQLQKQIDDGIASTSAALSDPTVLAPFFRFPGLLRSDVAEGYLASRGIQVWSTDVLADDWHRISSAKVYDLAMKRLEASRKGILLLHDIQARTAAALPNILHDLKAKGFQIVHVVPASPQEPATPTDPQDWQMNPPSETVPVARWPKIPNFVYAETDTLVAPALADFNTPDGKLLPPSERFGRAKRHGVPLPAEAPWPRLAALSTDNMTVTLPVPAQDLFEMPEDASAAFRSRPPRLAHAGESDTDARSKPASAERGRGARRHAGRGIQRTRHAVHATPGASRHPPHAGGGGARRPVRVANLKKR
jgi:peptidoglycan/xylan/chitin deacetylase (PgdA/CDA1 family)